MSKTLLNDLNQDTTFFFTSLNVQTEEPTEEKDMPLPTLSPDPLTSPPESRT